MGKNRGKGGHIQNSDLLIGENELDLKNKVNDETIKKTLEQREGLKRESAVKGIEDQKKGHSTRVPKLEKSEFYKNNALPKIEKVQAPKKQVTKGVALKKILGKSLGKVIPFVGAAITVKEGYDLVKEQLEDIQSQDPLQEQLQKLHKENPDQFPEPPKIDIKDDFSSISSEDKKKIMLAMNDFEKSPLLNEPMETTNQEKEKIMLAMNDMESEKPNSLIDIEQAIKKFPSTLEFGINENDYSTSIEDKENIMSAMRDIREIEKPDFLKNLEPNINFDPPEHDMDDLSDDGDSDGDGGSGDGE